MDSGASSYRRYLEGNESGFDEILILYRENLIFFINRYIGNYTVSEDLAEDTFLELLLHPKRYNFKTPLKTYLFAIARNKAIDWLRRSKRRKTIALDETESDNSDYACVEEKYIGDERKKALNDVLSNLKDDYRTALHLVYFEDMTNEETAKVMKKSKKQVENLLYRAKNALRVELQKRGYDA